MAMRWLIGLAALGPVWLLLVLAKAAAILLLGLLFPGLRRRGREIVATRPGRAFWWGLPVSIAGAIAVLFCLSLEQRGLPGAVGAAGVLLLGIVSTVLGFLGVAEHLGAEVLRRAGRPEGSPPAAMAVGLMLALAAGGVPLLGLFVGLLLAVLSLGTFLCILFGPDGGSA
jgi:hypothetical protein